MSLLPTVAHYFDLVRHPDALLVALGAAGVVALYASLAAIIFAETGAMVFFLPGDSLLVTAGIFVATARSTDLNLLWLNLLLIPCAILGDATSYAIGRRAGPRLFNRPRSRLFRPEHIEAAHRFYEKHGGKAIILARFMPIVRTFVPVVAGMGRMGYRQFAAWNVVGGAAWILSMTLVGYGLGNAFPAITSRIELLVMVIVFLSILPGLVQLVRARAARPAAVAGAPPRSAAE